MHFGMCTADGHHAFRDEGPGGERFHSSAWGMAQRGGRRVLVDLLQWSRSPFMGGLANAQGTPDLVRAKHPVDTLSTHAMRDERYTAGLWLHLRPFPPVKGSTLQLYPR